MILRNRIHREIVGALWGTLRIQDEVVRFARSGDVQFRQLSDDPTMLVRRLGETFDESDLVTAGIAARNNGGQLTASPRLLVGAAPVMALFVQNDLTPFDLLLPDGLLLGNELPLYAMVHDHRIQDLLHASKSAFLLVPTIEDVVSCIALGLAAAPTSGLERLNRDHFQSIAEVTAGRSIALSTPAQSIGTSAMHDPISTTVHDGALAEEGYMEGIQHGPARTDIDQIECPRELPAVDLVFSGWSFSLQRRVPGELLQRVTQRLAQGQQHLTEVDLTGIGVWVPTLRSAECLKFCWELHDQTALFNAVMESVGNGDLYDLGAAASGNIPLWQASQSFVEARRALWHRLHDSHLDPHELQAEIEAFESHLQREVVEPFMTNGMRAGNPIRGTLHMEFGQLSAILQCQAPFLQHDLVRAALRPESGELRSRLDQSVSMRMTVVDRLLKIARELLR
jgi:hypothetical protein